MFRVSFNQLYKPLIGKAVNRGGGDAPLGRVKAYSVDPKNPWFRNAPFDISSEHGRFSVKEQMFL